MNSWRVPIRIFCREPSTGNPEGILKTIYEGVSEGTAVGIPVEIAERIPERTL